MLSAISRVRSMRSWASSIGSRRSTGYGRSLYAKLDSGTKTSALNKARELGGI